MTTLADGGETSSGLPLALLSTLYARPDCRITLRCSLTQSITLQSLAASLRPVSSVEPSKSIRENFTTALSETVVLVHEIFQDFRTARDGIDVAFGVEFRHQRVVVEPVVLYRGSLSPASTASLFAVGQTISSVFPYLTLLQAIAPCRAASSDGR